MGDHADDALFAGLGESGAWSDRRLMARTGDPRWRKKCRDCGAFPLYWAQVGRRWVLHAKTADGEVPHRCPSELPPCG